MPPHLNWSDVSGRWHRPVAVAPLPARAPARQEPLGHEGLTPSLIHAPFGSGTNWAGDGGQLVSTDGSSDSAVRLRRRRRARRNARADRCAPAPLPSGVPAAPRTRPGGPPRTLPHSPTPAAAGTSKGPRMSTRPPASRRARAALAVTALLAGTALTALPAGTASAADGDLAVQYRTSATGAVADQSEPWLKVRNTGSTTV